MANQPNAVGAIGHIDIYPNSRNIIPGQVVCTVDMRTHLLDKLNGMVSEFQKRAPKICKDIEVDFECSIVGQFDPPALMKIVLMQFEVLLRNLATVIWI